MANLQKISLSSGWKMNWSEYQCNTGKFSAADMDDSSWHNASVPGDVHIDLMGEGIIPDPFVGTNCDLIRWMEEKDWWYRTRFELPAGWEAEGHSVRLFFHGLDCFATVYLNGKEMGHHTNMFTPFEIDVTGQVKSGKNVLAVRLASPIFAPLDNSSRAPTWWGYPRQLTRKAQMSYGWDIAPRIVTVGIWRPVELICIDRARIGEPWIRTASLDMASKSPSAKMEAVIPVETLESAGPLKVWLEVEGREIGTVALPPKKGLHEAAFKWDVKKARLWWPNGSGESYLYPYRVRVVAKDGAILDERSGGFGIRTVTLDRSPTKDGGHNFKFSINGREIFMRGWDWTPPDAIFARIAPERRMELLLLARDSGANILRVWGGGIYEPQDFYDACDRLGLCIMQDFMFACSEYPQDEEFLDEVRTEAEWVVTALRSHPCITLWSGDNECDMCYPDQKEAAKNRINREAIPEVVKRLDPSTPFIPTSPHSPGGKMYNDVHDSEAHLWHHGYSYDDPYFMSATPKFVSEIGFLSLPSIEVLRAIFGGEPTWPPDDLTWQFHSADCIHSQLFRGMKHLLKNFEACGRPAPQNVLECINGSQEMQAEAFKTWVKHFASRPECGGIILWNLADCWPQMSDAVIAWPLYIKKAYHTAKTAFLSIGRK